MKLQFCFSVAIFILVFSTGPRPAAQTNQSNRQLTQRSTPQTQGSQRRVALVIGNGAYDHTGKLANPPNDATLVAATLRQLGFEVKNGANLTQREMKQRIREFGQSLRANGGVGLFYFAGHGVQAKGHNYIVPVDADIQTEADLEDMAVDLNYVLSLMDDAQNALNIVVLDACRNNPFARSFRSAQEGLAQVKAPTGTLIAYATAPDSIAADGTGTNSPYTQELIKQLQSSGVLVETMFRRVTERVSSRTNGKQEPWFSANVKGDFYFTGSPTNPTTTNLSLSNSGDTSISRIDPAAIELSYWESIKNSTDPEDFKSYLEKYPNGQFAELARRRIGSQPTASPSSSTVASNNSVAAQSVKAGDDLVRERKWADAEGEYKIAVRLDPENAESHNKLGYVLHQNGKFSEAETEYRTALRLAPNNAEAHYGVGRALREQKKVVEAEAELREALRLEPNNAKFHGALGNTLGLYQQRWGEAEAELGQAIRLEPNNPEWHGTLSSVLRAQKKYAECQAELGHAIRLDPINARWHYLLSATLAEQQKYVEAEVEAREAVRLAPNESWTHSFLSRLLEQQDKFSEAETEARETIRLNPKDPYGHWVLGTSLLGQKKDAGEAEKSLREAVRLQPGEGFFHHNLGVALERQGKKAEADAEYNEERRLNPELRAKDEEAAKHTKSFKGSFGTHDSLLGYIGSPGDLLVSPDKIRFVYANTDASYTRELQCSTKLKLDGPFIREITVKGFGNDKWRFQAESPSEAARALTAIQEACAQH